MISHKVHPDADSAMAHLLDSIITRGAESAPRGKKIRELVGHAVAFEMSKPIVTVASRKMGYRFYPAEAVWILSGRNDRKFFEDLKMPFIWEFSDDGFFYQGAYGPPVVDQLSYVCDVLSDDNDTRQAVMTIWRPNPRPSRDIPCTLSFQFIARDGYLHCIQSMRSSDAWLGYPYDVYNASALTTYVILLLRERAKRGRKELKLGAHTMFMGSSHVYEPNWEGALKFIDDRDVVDYAPMNPNDFDRPAALLEFLIESARDDQGINPRTVQSQSPLL